MAGQQILPTRWQPLGWVKILFNRKMKKCCQGKRENVYFSSRTKWRFLIFWGVICVYIRETCDSNFFVHFTPQCDICSHKLYDLQQNVIIYLVHFLDLLDKHKRYHIIIKFKFQRYFPQICWFFKMEWTIHTGSAVELWNIIK